MRFWGCTRFFRQPQTVQTETLWNFLTFNDIVDQTMGRLREENAKLRSQVMELQALRTAWNIGTICFFSHVVLSFLSENRWTWGKYPKILWCIILYHPLPHQSGHILMGIHHFWTKPCGFYRKLGGQRSSTGWTWDCCFQWFLITRLYRFMVFDTMKPELGNLERESRDSNHSNIWRRIAMRWNS